MRGMTHRQYAIYRFYVLVDRMRWAREFRDIHAIAYLSLALHAAKSDVPKRHWSQANKGESKIMSKIPGDQCHVCGGPMDASTESSEPGFEGIHAICHQSPAQSGLTLAQAAQAIIEARDHHAEHGCYPADTLDKDQCFDDWAADLLSHAIGIAKD